MASHESKAAQLFLALERKRTLQNRLWKQKSQGMDLRGVNSELRKIRKEIEKLGG